MNEHTTEQDARFIFGAIIIIIIVTALVTLGD